MGGKKRRKIRKLYLSRRGGGRQVFGVAKKETKKEEESFSRPDKKAKGKTATRGGH